MNKKIGNLHTEEMPVEKLFSLGAENLSTAELISILLKTGTKNTDVLTLSRQLISDFGSIKGLRNAEMEELINYEGIGAKKAATLMSAFELADRLNKYQKKKKYVFGNARDVFNFVKNDMRFGAKECFLVVALNSKLEVIATDVISVGTQTKALVNPREVFSFALKKSAHRLVVCHNHPSGHVKPSDTDLLLTEKLIKAGKTIGIEVVDHVIVSNNDYYSMKQNKDI